MSAVMKLQSRTIPCKDTEANSIGMNWIGRRPCRLIGARLARHRWTAAGLPVSGVGYDDVLLIPNAFEDRQDRVVDAHNRRFGKQWVQYGIAPCALGLPACSHSRWCSSSQWSTKSSRLEFGMAGRGIRSGAEPRGCAMLATAGSRRHGP